MPKQCSELVVIGAGAMRTGTLSQKAAFEILLGKPSYHMKDVVMKRRDHFSMWIEACNSGLTKRLAESIFEGYASCCDYPAAAFYKELLSIYPNAKVVLSVRDPESWIHSVQESVMQIAQMIDAMPFPLRWLLGLTQFTEMARAMFRHDFGVDVDLANTQLMIRLFEERNAAVRRAVPPERLLEFRVSDGWGPLCEFLDLPVPSEPFPRLNDQARVKRILRVVTLGSYTANAIAAVGLVACAVWLHDRFLA